MHETHSRKCSHIGVGIATAYSTSSYSSSACSIAFTSHALTSYVRLSATTRPLPIAGALHPVCMKVFARRGSASSSATLGTSTCPLFGSTDRLLFGAAHSLSAASTHAIAAPRAPGGGRT
eukprot:1240004-Rhodomonas_salina.1